MKTKLKVLIGLVLLMFLTTSLTLVALAETSTEDEARFSHEEVGLAPGGIGLLATFNVNSTNDAPDANPGNGTCATAGTPVCTLRAAIEEANGNGPGLDTINLPAGTYVLTHADGDLQITTDITILGADANTTSIDGNNDSRIFRIQSTGAATISRVTLTNGNGIGGAEKGGAIWIFHGVLTLLDSIVTGNATANNDGGGILNEHGTLTINDSIITNNEGHGGGGISNRDGAATINNTIISENTSLSAGLLNPGVGVGGGVSNTAVTDDSTLTINQSSITTNTATGTGGGGVNNNASGTDHTAITTLNQTLVSGNDAAPLVISSTTGFGGGIRNGFADPVNGTTAAIVVVNDSTISDNEAVNAGGIGNGTESTASTLTLKMTLNNSTVSGNTTVSNNISNQLIGNGGGLVNVNGVMSLINSTVSRNAANGTNPTLGGYGGGIFNGDLSRATTMWLTNTTVSSNTVENNGEGVANFKAGSATPNANFKNSIIAGGCFNFNGTLTSHGNNLDDDNTCNLVASGDIANTDPRLGSLQSNGGPTVGAAGATAPMLTHALQEGSPALGAGDQSVCAAAPINNLDQRGVIRPATDPACDSGSFESPFEGPNNETVYLPLVMKNN